MAKNLLKDRSFQITGTVILVLNLNLHRMVLNQMLNIDILPAAIDAFVDTFLLGVSVAVITQVLAYYRPVKNRYVFVAMMALVMSLFWIASVTYFLKFCFSGYPAYIEFLMSSFPIRFALGWTMITSTSFIAMLLYEMHDQRDIIGRREATEKMAREAELFKLRQQLSPHFLFNSLNSINALVKLRPDEARQMIQQLSDFLRGTLKKEDQQWIPLKEELQYLQLYLDIEKVRFRHRLSTVFEQAEDTEGMQIPPMLLQPVVENAIKFGLYDTTEAITIEIKAWQERGELIVTVSNPFDPALQSQPSLGTGFGLNSIARRLYLLFARQDLLETKHDNQVFTTIIKVPQPS